MVADPGLPANLHHTVDDVHRPVRHRDCHLARLLAEQLELFTALDRAERRVRRTSLVRQLGHWQKRRSAGPAQNLFDAAFANTLHRRCDRRKFRRGPALQRTMARAALGPKRRSLRPRRPHLRLRRQLLHLRTAVARSAPEPRQNPRRTDHHRRRPYVTPFSGRSSRGRPHHICRFWVRCGWSSSAWDGFSTATPFCNRTWASSSARATPTSTRECRSTSSRPSSSSPPPRSCCSTSLSAAGGS